MKEIWIEIGKLILVFVAVSVYIFFEDPDAEDPFSRRK